MASSDWTSVYQNQYYQGIDQSTMINTTSNGNISLNSSINAGVIFQTTSTSTGYWPMVSDGTGGVYQQYYSTMGGSPVNIPVTIEPFRMKSAPVAETGPHDHVIECRLIVENVKVFAEYFCFHCNEVVHRKVISKLPKSILNKKCLPRLVKGV